MIQNKKTDSIKNIQKKVLAKKDEQEGTVKFKKLMRNLSKIISGCVQSVQLSNRLLIKVWKPLIKRAVSELKDEYHEKLMIRPQGQQQKVKYEAIKKTLNIIAKQGATDVDELFINLAQKINKSCGKKRIKVIKTMPYIHKCKYCQQNISNTTSKLQRHQKSCPQKDLSKNIQSDMQNQRTTPSAREFSTKFQSILSFNQQNNQNKNSIINRNFLSPQNINRERDQNREIQYSEYSGNLYSLNNSEQSSNNFQPRWNRYQTFDVSRSPSDYEQNNSFNN